MKFEKVFGRVFPKVSLPVVLVLSLCLSSVCRAGEPITLVFGGDVMFDRDVEHNVMMIGDNNYAFPWYYIADFFKQADIAFVNLESPITDKGSANFLKPSPWFRADPLAVNGLLYAGIDIVSVANNHALDYNRTGFVDSLARLKAAGIKYTGGGLTYNEAYSPLYVSVKEKKIAFLGFMSVKYSSWSAIPAFTYGKFTYPGAPGIAWLSTSALKQGIARAKADNADLIVVSMHWGDEYSAVPNSFQQKYAHLAIDLGADLVVGHHSHVTQPNEVYNGKYIFYSMGNLIFDQSESNHAGVTRGEVLEAVWQDGIFTAIKEHFVDIDEGTCQPAFEE